MQAINAEANVSTELSSAELDLVSGGHGGYRQVFEVDLGNMTITGYIGKGGQTMGVASSDDGVVIKGPVPA